MNKLPTPQARVRALARYIRGSSLSWKDIADLTAKPSQIARVSPHPLIRLRVTPHDLGDPGGAVRFVGKTRYLNGARTVVTLSVDDAREHLPACLDAMDQYGIKATVFVNVPMGPLSA